MTNGIYAFGSNSQKTIFSLLSVVLICGCATPTPAQFQPGSDSKQFARDEYACERDARSIQGDSCTQMEFFEKCMRANGYAEISGSSRKGLCSRVF